MDKNIERSELKKYIYNPEMIQKKVLDLIENIDNTSVGITSATSPFTMLLEATAATTANAVNES